MWILCLQTFQIPFSWCRSQTYIILKGRAVASLHYNVTAQVMVTHSFNLKSVFKDNVTFFSCGRPQGCGVKIQLFREPLHPKTKKIFYTRIFLISTEHFLSLYRIIVLQQTDKSVKSYDSICIDWIYKSSLQSGTKTCGDPATLFGIWYWKPHTILLHRPLSFFGTTQTFCAEFYTGLHNKFAISLL
jgi:hypothetical protein